MVQTPRAQLAAVLEGLDLGSSPRSGVQGGSASIDSGEFSDSVVRGSPSTIGTVGSVKGESFISSSLPGYSTAASQRKYRLWCCPSDSDICLGLKGQGQTFCTLTNCTKNHRTGSFQPALPGEVYVAKTSDSAFVNPYLSGIKLSDDLLDSWKATLCTLQEWIRLFSLVKLQNDDDENEEVEVKPVSKEDLLQSQSLFANAMEFKTPRKKNISFAAEANDLVPTFTNLNITDDKDPSTDGQRDMLGALRALDERSVSLRDALQALQEQLTQNDATTNSLFDIADIKYQDLKTDVGSKPLVLDGNFDAPSIWLTIAQIIDEFTSFSDTHSSEVQSFRKDIEILKRDLNSIPTNVKLHFSPLEDRIEALQDFTVKMARQLKARVDQVNIDPDRFRLSGPTNLEARIKNLELGPSSVATLEARLHRLESTPVLVSGDSDSQERLRKLEAELASLRSATDEATIQYGGLGFRTKADCNAWIEIHQPKDNYGLLMDFNTVMEHVYCQIVGQKLLSNLERIYKMKMTSNNQAVAMTSFETRLPKFFMGDSRVMTVVKSGDSYFKAIKSWEEWNSPDDGYRDQLKAEVHRFEVGHNETINGTLDSLSPFHTLCNKTLTDSCGWVHRLVKFIDDTYREYNRAHYNARKAWHVTTKLALSLMEQVATPRNVVHNSFQVHDSMAISKSIAYANFRSLDLMLEISNLDFKNSPVITAELTKFLALNSNIEVVESLKTRLEKLSEEVGKASKTAAAAEKSGSTIGNNVDNFKRDLLALSKRVKTLENK